MPDLAKFTLIDGSINTLRCGSAEVLVGYW